MKVTTGAFQDGAARRKMRSALAMGKACEPASLRDPRDCLGGAAAGTDGLCADLLEDSARDDDTLDLTRSFEDVEHLYIAEKFFD